MSGHGSLPDKIVVLALKHLLFGLSASTPAGALHPHLEALLFKVLLPMMQNRPDHDSLLDSDEVEWIRADEDLTSNMVRTTAIDLVTLLAKFSTPEGHSLLLILMQHCIAQLDSPACPAPMKEVLLFCIYRLKNRVFKVKELKRSCPAMLA